MSTEFTHTCTYFEMVSDKKSASALESANWSENRVILFSEMLSVQFKERKIGENS